MRIQKDRNFQTLLTGMQNSLISFLEVKHTLSTLPATVLLGIYSEEMKT